MKKLPVILFVLFSTGLFGQSAYTTFNAHSHNDYKQKVPFFWAYQAHFGSIEADIWAVNGQLMVAHSKDEIKKERSLDALYIQPVVNKFKENKGKAWSDGTGTLQLLIELKSGYKETLPLLVNKLRKYPTVFDPAVNPGAVRVVITGNVPPPAEFVNFPQFIFFDGDLTQKYSSRERARVAMFSSDLSRYTSWKGEGGIPEKDAAKLRSLIDSVHALQCKVRFWDAPDTPFAWKQLQALKVDFINTDHIQQLEKFLTKK